MLRIVLAVSPNSPPSVKSLTVIGSEFDSLNDPLGLTLAVNGDILTTNGNDGYLVETTRKGVQKSKTLLDDTGNPPGAGTLFGLIDVPGQGVYFVDDGSNTLNLLH